MSTSPLSGLVGPVDESTLPQRSLPSYACAGDAHRTTLSVNVLCSSFFQFSGPPIWRVVLAGGFEDNRDMKRQDVFDTVESEVLRGKGEARDPTNAVLPPQALRVTTVNSPWFGERCRYCHHRFREDDRVRLCLICKQPLHDDEQFGLQCWSGWYTEHKTCTERSYDQFHDREVKGCSFRPSEESLVREHKTQEEDGPPAAPRPNDRLAAQFVGGLESIWQPFGEQKVERVRQGSPLVGLECQYCTFTLRVGDHVVACPCGDDCGAWFHQDVYRRLTCWNKWSGTAGREYCPVSSRAYKEEEGE